MSRFSTWREAGMLVACQAADRLPGRLESKTGPVGLTLALEGQAAYTIAAWTVDPYATQLARAITRDLVFRALEVQPVPFDGSVVVRVAGKVMCRVRTQVGRRHG